MELFNIAFIVSIIIVVFMVALNASVVILRYKNSKKKQKDQGIMDVNVDWQVYIVEKDGNCLSKGDINLENEKDEFIIGRSDESSLKLKDEHIGRKHAKVTRKGIVYTYYDLGSRAGSICNHEKIESKRLEHMMVVWVEKYALVFANCDVSNDELAKAVRNSPQ
jgi:hypothetical protein